jgi:hypothetical protein
MPEHYDEPMTVKGRFAALEQNRMPYLTRARESARLTIGGPVENGLNRSLKARLGSSSAPMHCFMMKCSFAVWG